MKRCIRIINGLPTSCVNCSYEEALEHAFKMGKAINALMPGGQVIFRFYPGGRILKTECRFGDWFPAFNVYEEGRWY